MNEQSIIDETNRLAAKDEKVSYLYLKCHTCKEVLKRHTEGGETLYECSSAHASVKHVNDQFISYVIIWDAKPNGQERYRIISSAYNTILQLSTTEKYWRPYYKTVLTIDSHLTLPVKDDTIVVDNLIPRLQKLKAFS